MLSEAQEGLVRPSFSSSNEPFGVRHPVAAGFAASAISVGTATFLTNWVDVIKVRQQLAGAEGKHLLATGISVVREEGALALYRGVTPAVARGLLYGGESPAIFQRKASSLSYSWTPTAVLTFCWHTLNVALCRSTPWSLHSFQARLRLRRRSRPWFDWQNWGRNCKRRRGSWHLQSH